jgi:hypothetical protein
VNHAAQQFSTRLVDRAAVNKIVKRERAARGNTKGQQSAVDSYRRDDGMEANTIRQARINMRRSIVQPPPRGCRQSLSQPTQVSLGLEAHVRAREALTSIHPDLSASIHENVGDARLAEERLKATRADHVLSHPDDEIEDGVVAENEPFVS